jgi:ribosomal protein L7/L12
MNTEIELPADVIAELQANRKVTAIKLLRKRQNIGLKEAKELVDVYLEQHPSKSSFQVPESDSGIGRIAILIFGAAVIYGIYKYFS